MPSEQFVGVSALGPAEYGDGAAPGDHEADGGDESGWPDVDIADEVVDSQRIDWAKIYRVALRTDRLLPKEEEQDFQRGTSRVPWFAEIAIAQ